MILVTLGTQDKNFVRLLKSVQEQIDKGVIKDKVIVQAGCTKFDTNDMELFDLIDRDEFKKLLKKCDLLITHGGVGTILDGLKNNKVIISCPRLFKYGEHINDHQLEIVEKFSKGKYLLAYNDGDDLRKILEKAKKFKPQKYISNTSNMVKIIENFIDNA